MPEFSHQPEWMLQGNGEALLVGDRMFGLSVEMIRRLRTAERNMLEKIMKGGSGEAVCWRMMTKLLYQANKSHRKDIPEGGLRRDRGE